MNDQAADTQAALADETQQFRSQVGHISRQSGIFFAGTVFTTGFSYVFKVYLARVLGAQELGLYALGVTLIGFFGIFNSLGLPQSAVRFVASYLAAGKFKELHALLWRGAGILIAANVILATVLLTFGRFLAVRLYHAPALVRYLPYFAVIMLASLVTGFYGKVLVGYRDIKQRTLIVNFIGGPLNMLLAVLLISAGMGLRGYLVAQILSAVVVSILLLATVRRFTPASARFLGQSSSSPKREVWSFSASMLGLGLLEFMMSQVDRVVLGYYRGARDVGIYSVAAALVAYVPLALSSINQIFAPTIADLHTRGEHALLARLFRSLTKWSIGVTLPLAFVVIVFARPLTSIFGADFQSGWPILIIGTIGQLVNCGVGSVGYLLLMSGNERRLMRVQATMALVMTVSTVTLVPLLGVVAAAAAAAITTTGMNLGNLLEVKKALGITPYNRSYWRLVVPTVATLAVIFVLHQYSNFLGHNWLAIGLALFSGYLVFAFVVLVTGLDADDRLIASAIRSKMRGTIRIGAP